MPRAEPPSLTLSEEHKVKLRGFLEQAFGAAQDYDGSEAAETRLIDPLNLYDEFVRAQSGGVMSPDLEAKIAKTVFPDHPANMPVTISGFLGAAEDFYNRLRDAGSSNSLSAILERGGAVVIDDPRVFVKTDEGRLREAESANPEHYEVKTQPRLALLIGHLRNDGVNGQKIYMDDLVIRKGDTDPHMLREHPYTIVQIPRLNMEVAVCDQVGEITFVKKGTVGPEFWDYMSKDALKAREDVRAVAFHNEANWWDGISEALAQHGAEGRKIRMSQWITHQPNLDLDLIKASLLAHYRETGEWLSPRSQGQDGKSFVLKHGPYKEQISVGSLDSSLREGHNGLPGGASIARLNAEISAQHGLDYFNHMDQPNLDLGLIRESLLAHRQATGEWLTTDKKLEDGNRGSYVLQHGPLPGRLQSLLYVQLWKEDRAAYPGDTRSFDSVKRFQPNTASITSILTTRTLSTST